MNNNLRQQKVLLPRMGVKQKFSHHLIRNVWNENSEKKKSDRVNKKKKKHICTLQLALVMSPILVYSD